MIDPLSEILWYAAQGDASVDGTRANADATLRQGLHSPADHELVVKVYGDSMEAKLFWQALKQRAVCKRAMEIPRLMA